MDLRTRYVETLAYKPARRLCKPFVTDVPPNWDGRTNVKLPNIKFNENKLGNFLNCFTCKMALVRIC
jgi:hypothetical protein